MTIKTPGRDKEVKKEEKQKEEKAEPKILCYLRLASFEQTSKQNSHLR